MSLIRIVFIFFNHVLPNGFPAELG